MALADGASVQGVFVARTQPDLAPLGAVSPRFVESPAGSGRAAYGAGAGLGGSEATPPSKFRTDGMAITPIVMRRKITPAP
jgi:hypothetical protein